MRRRSWNGAKLAIGIGVLLLVTVVSAVAGWGTLREIGEGSGRSAVQDYLAGDGHRFRSDDGGFAVLLPEVPEERVSTIDLADGATEIRGVQASLGDDRKVRVSWLDLESSPTADEAAFVLPAVAVFVGQDVESTPTEGAMREGTEHPTYDFVLEVLGDPAVEQPTTVVDARLILVESRIFLFRVEGTDLAPEILDFVATEFELRS